MEMDAKKATKLLHEAAEEIRRITALQVEAWQTVPYWTLESEGRGGWADGWGIPYKYGLVPADGGWPHRLFVEAATGRLVQSMRDSISDAPDDAILTAFINSPLGFDASYAVSSRMQRATDGNDTYNKEVNDQRRDELRERYKVPMKWTEHAKPIVYTYQD